MKRPLLVVIAALGLAAAGCALESDQTEPAHYLDPETAAPRVEGVVLVDPVVETPLDPVWRESWLPIDNQEREQQRSVTQVFDLAAARPGMRIADVGAGGGFFAFRWAMAVGPTGFVHAIDIDARMTRKLSYERARRGVANMDVTQVPAGTLGLSPDSVDLVTFLDTGAFKQCDPALNDGYFRQAAEALHPGGHLLVLNNAEVAGGNRECGVPSAEGMIAAASSRFTLVSQHTLQKGGGWTAWLILFERRS